MRLHRRCSSRVGSESGPCRKLIFCTIAHPQVGYGIDFVSHDGDLSDSSDSDSGPNCLKWGWVAVGLWTLGERSQ